jgi:hypothetical protein
VTPGPPPDGAVNLAGDPRVSLSAVDHERPAWMTHLRGPVAERLNGDAALAIIDRLAHEYIGGPYHRELDRVFLVLAEHALAPRLLVSTAWSKARAARRRVAACRSRSRGSRSGGFGVLTATEEA